MISVIRGMNYQSALHIGDESYIEHYTYSQKKRENK